MRLAGFLIGLESEDIPFFMEESNIYIIKYIDIPKVLFKEDTLEYDIVKGYTNSNHNIYFIGCKYNKKAFSAQGFIVAKNNLVGDNLDTFETIVFSGNVVNTFYPPKIILDYEEGKKYDITDRMRSIYPKQWKDVEKEFKIEINDEEMDIKLYISMFQDLNPNKSTIGEVESKISITPKTPPSAKEVPRYFLYMLDFFRFINFRQNIEFDEIMLLNKVGTYTYSYEIHIFYEKKPYKYTRSHRDSIVFSDISDNFGSLFKEVVERRNNDIFDNLYIPKDDEHFKTVDFIEYLSCALSFEGEFERIFPPKSEVNSIFLNEKIYTLDLINRIREQVLDENKLNDDIKNKIVQGINEHKENMSTELSGKQLKKIENYIDNIIRTIEKLDYSLAEQFNLVIKSYGELSTNVKQYICDNYRIEEPNKENLGNIFAEMRNKIGHGTPIKMESKHIYVYLLARCMIYIMVLDKAHINKDTIFKIIKKIF